MTIKAKALTSQELSQIEAEWNDSKTVESLLGHISYLTEALIKAAHPAEGEAAADG